jgi:hypothetical protein
MEKKEKKLKPKLPFLQSAITPDEIKLNVDPRAVTALTAGRSQIAKEFFEQDLERLRGSLNLKHKDTKLQMKEPDQIRSMAAKVDLRSGKAEISHLLPKQVQMTDERIPNHPVEALNAAMKKLNAKRLR